MRGISRTFILHPGVFTCKWAALNLIHLSMVSVILQWSHQPQNQKIPVPSSHQKKQTTIPISWVYSPYVCDEPFGWGIFQRWGQQRCTGPRYSVRICSHTAAKAPFLSQLLKPGRRKHLHLRYGFWFRRLGAIKDRATGWRCFNLCEFGVVAAQPT